jgi:hypothetical protein
MPTKKKEYKDLEIKHEATFQFAHYENAQNVGMALALAGRFINIKRQDGGAYLLMAYILT